MAIVDILACRPEPMNTAGPQEFPLAASAPRRNGTPAGRSSLIHARFLSLPQRAHFLAPPPVHPTSGLFCDGTRGRELQPQTRERNEVGKLA